MKMCISLAVSIVTAAVILSFLPVHGEEQIYDAVIRLHVLAVSDREEDQAVKRNVRDHVLAQITPMLDGVTERERAAEIVRENLQGIEDSIGTFLEEQGCRETVRLFFTEEMYPTREYDAFTLPAGEYLSLRVVLGEGKGQNWWCVLFPSVCSRFAMQDTEALYREAGFTPEQYRLITHSDTVQYQVRFRLLEILEALKDSGRTLWKGWDLE
ncbi:MAG: stage II sporulation protein R [Clostridia bacterium]|nr:stage II sporulation protein R [Clostridia bacterium]